MNEREIIAHFAKLAATGGPGLIQGIGDDCAVVQKDDSSVWLLTMDTLVESVHFDCSWHPPEKLGRKAVSVNVSDIAAMGGKPAFILLSVGLPPDFDPQWFDAFSRGVTSACREYGCFVIGGDTVCSPERLHFTLTVIGEAEARKVVYRTGAQPEDTIWVSGELGLAAAGLALFTTGTGGEDPAFEKLMEAHLNPQARVEFGYRLADLGCVHAMMDLSDGLATDLAHLCKRSEVGARIIAATLPKGKGISSAAEITGNDPHQWAIGGGEDYELLFTAHPQDSERILRLAKECNLDLFQVGTIHSGRGVTLVRNDATGHPREFSVAYEGYDHFKS